jgi:3-hydroxyacyl-[acyl-carrier-protein] dehydratase
MNTATHWTVPLDHPALAGHFPGTPILPGVVLLDMALQAIANASGIALDRCAISSVKFLSPAKPGDALVIEHVVSASGTIRFEIAAGTRKVASGSVAARPPA